LGLAAPFSIFITQRLRFAMVRIIGITKSRRCGRSGRSGREKSQSMYLPIANMNIRFFATDMNEGKVCRVGHIAG
jgi:hypothetical protein